MHDISEIKKHLENNKQSHLLKFYNELSTKEQQSLFNELVHIDFPHISGEF